jgi:hypothetical protein
MHLRKPGSAQIGLSTGLIVALLSSASANAQAWLPPKGEASLSLGYGNLWHTKHYLGLPDPDGTTTIDVGHTRVQSVGLQLGYGITDRLAVSVGLPFVFGKYEGAFPHRTNGVIVQDDDGRYHGTFQDYRIDLAYQLFNGPIAVSPFFTAVIPSHSYPFYSHAAPGRDLYEYHLGFSAGGRLDRILTGTYAEITYSYAFVEESKVIDLNLDRSNLGLVVGYFVTPSLAVRFLGSGYYTHGGLVFRTPANLPPELVPYHDQIAKTSAVILGGGVSYVLTGSTEISASYVRSVYGRGGHKIDDGLSLGVTWSFSPAQIIRRTSPPPAGKLEATEQ